MSDTNEAIARLREAVEASTEYRLSNVTTKVNDLLVLLAEHAALEAAHAEALDALKWLRDVSKGRNLRGLPLMDAQTRADRIVGAVLTKAGRR